MDLAAGGPGAAGRGAGRYGGDPREPDRHRSLARFRQPARPTEEPDLKADPFAQLKLLDLQELDARADQLRHRLATLPEHAELAELPDHRTELEDQLIDARDEVEDLTAEQEKVDADVEAVKARRVRDRDRMDQGLITNPKDLERMQHELVSLERRISSLEDDEIEVMEQLEEAQAELDRLRRGPDGRATSGVAALARPRREDRRDRGRAGRGRRRARADRRRAARRPARALRQAARAARAASGPPSCAPAPCGGCRLSLDAAELARDQGRARATR